MPFRIRATTRNTMADAIRTDMDAGAGPATLKFYTGSQPATPETAIGAQTLLGTLTFTDPAAPGASGGVLSFSAITEDSSADATGTATWARCESSTPTAIWDADVGVTGSGASIEMNSVSFVAGGPIRIPTIRTLTIPG